MTGDRLRAWGGLLSAVSLLPTILYEYGGQDGLVALSGLLVVMAIGCFIPGMALARLVFVLVGLALVIWAVLTRGDWMSGVGLALGRGGVVIGVFVALVALRSAAMSSAAILECGRFLAAQKPGRRYLALTMGGHVFALVLLYGSISLLGTLAVESVARVTDPETRALRARRMLVAIQRGFSATLCWSPIAFAMVVATTLIPGANWAAAALPAMVTALMLLALGWVLDALFKPRRRGPPVPDPAEVTGTTGGWLRHVYPLLVLLGVVATGVAVLYRLTGVAVLGAVMSLVPVVSILWIYLQERRRIATPARRTRNRIADFALREMPKYRAEILLLFMAAFIGGLGAFLLVPLMGRFGLNLTQVPPEVILTALVCIIPLAGQCGMNPLLSVSLLVPLLPSPAMLGIDPVAMVVAVTGGWALCGTTSPYTASVLLVGALGKAPARRVGLVWNGPYALLMIPLISLWAISLG